MSIPAASGLELSALGDFGNAIERRFLGFFERGVGFRITEVAVCRKTKTGKRNPIIRAWRKES